MTLVTTQTRKRIEVAGPGHAVVKDTSPLPKLQPDHILVRVHAVALNPTDWKHLDGQPITGCGLGVDFAGVVEALPQGELKRTFKIGDRVLGSVHGGNQSNPEEGAFAEVIATNTGTAMRIPDGMSFEDAATMGTGVLSVGQGLYEELGLPMPGSDLSEEKQKPTILIWGGSSATGTLAIQFAKLSGYKVITTCSPNNFALVKSRGADVVFDYKSPNIVSDLRSATDSNLTHVLDCIGAYGSPEICYSVITDQADAEKRYCSLVFPVEPQAEANKVKNIKISMVFAYLALNAAFRKFGMDYPHAPERYEFAAKFFETAEKLTEEGKVLPHPKLVGDGGLNGVIDGMQKLKRREVSGEKLVYAIA